MVVMSVFGNAFLDELISPAAYMSLSTLSGALLVAVGYLSWKRWQRNRRVKPRVLLRALFRTPRFARSHIADVGFMIFNQAGAGLLVGWAMLSFNWVANTVVEGLVATFGAQPVTHLSELSLCFIMMVLLLQRARDGPRRRDCPAAEHQAREQPHGT